jgi:large subunit ribosomal protein L24
VQATLDVSAGQVRLSKFAANGGDARLAIGGNLDLTNGSLKGRLVLSGRKGELGARPDIFLVLDGPVTAPARHLDVSALIGWLTVRAVDKQAKQLQEFEK